MKACREVLIFALIGCLMSGGCQSGSLPGTVAEYRPASTPVEIRAAESGIFVLWRWVPAAPLAGEDSTQPTKSEKDRAVEVQEVFAEQGSLVGFRRSAGQLSAFAGTTSVSLEDDHFAWTSQSLANLQTDGPHDAADFMVQWWFWTSMPAFFWLVALAMGHGGY